MTIYLIKGYIDQAATSLADAQSLYTALLDPSTATNNATIGRINGKLENLVQSDTGEPLVISSIDDANGTYSSWVTDAGTTLAVGLGDPDPSTAFQYAGTSSFAISGNTRTGTLALNTDALKSALSGSFSARSLAPLRGGKLDNQFYLQIQKTTGGVTRTMALLPIIVFPGIIAATSTSSILTPTLTAGAVVPIPGITSLTGGGSTTLDGIVTGTTASPTTVTGATVLLSYGRVGQTWQLIAGTDAEAPSAGVVRPDDYNATTNARIWVQL